MNHEHERSIFLSTVKLYVRKDPEVAAFISDFVQQGLKDRLDEMRQHAADMEIALAILAEKRYKQSDNIVLEKLKKWNGKTFIKWDWLIERLEKKNEPSSSKI